MGEVMAEVGGDGFLITQDYLTRRSISEITDGLVPELQKRGLTRDHYRTRCSATTCSNSEGPLRRPSGSGSAQ